jgi:hypothetical protein
MAVARLTWRYRTIDEMRYAARDKPERGRRPSLRGAAGDNMIQSSSTRHEEKSLHPLVAPCGDPANRCGNQ